MVKLPIAALIAVVTLLGGFYGGYRIGQSGSSGTALAQTGGPRTPTNGFTLNACPSPGASPSPNARAIRRGATGTITALTATSMTIHDSRCNTDTTITFDRSVIVRKTTDGQVSDLQENVTVAVQGQRQADGSIKANVITIVPAGSTVGGFGGAGAGTGG